MLHLSRGRRLRRPLLAAPAAGAAALVAALTVLPAAPATTAPSTIAPSRIAPSPGAASTDRSARAERAEQALAALQRTLDGPAAGRGTSASPDRTLLLRDLAVGADALEGDARRRARELLARPTSAGSDSYGNPHYGRLRNGERRPVGRVCGDHVCVHWVESGRHRVADDGKVRSVPGWVRKNLAELEHVHATYVAAGYRPVKGDGKRGGDDRADVYLANVGVAGLYGYCTSDQRMPRSGAKAVWAYCVLDNDFSRREFGTNTPLGNMRVTAAHEYFHAVQFAHDVTEDAWFMEATATWAEDELYDDVDDNLNYLSSSPLQLPTVPVDTFSGTFHYGTWIYFRFLTERLADETGGLPTLVRDMWARAAGTAADPRGQYSLQAIRGTLDERGVSFGEAFAAFADANRHPDDSYAEAVENDYPTARPRRFDRQRGWWTTKLRHLTSASTSVRPTSTSAEVVVTVDLAPTSRGSYAVVTRHPKTGPVQAQLVPLDADGDGSLTLPFAAADTARVDVTLVNASTRMRCGAGGDYSCHGTPRDEPLAARFKVSLR